MEYHIKFVSWKVLLHTDGGISFWDKTNNYICGNKYNLGYLLDCLSHPGVVIDYVMTEDDIKYWI